MRGSVPAHGDRHVKPLPASAEKVRALIKYEQQKEKKLSATVRGPRSLEAAPPRLEN